MCKIHKVNVIIFALILLVALQNPNDLIYIILNNVYFLTKDYKHNQTKFVHEQNRMRSITMNQIFEISNISIHLLPLTYF